LSVYSEILEKLKSKKVHMTLIDPASQNVEKAVSIAQKADKAGTDFFMIGGSTKVYPALIDKTIEEIKKVTDKKIIIFPGSSESISKKADAIYYMMLMNSQSNEFLIGHQVRSSIILKKLGIETISMGYLIFDPGMTVGRVGNAMLIKRDDEMTALSYALAAEMFGFKLLYLESGSGSPTHVSENVISRIKREVKIPLIVGGGIRDYESAHDVLSAGADIIVTGTVIEKSVDVYQTLKEIINAF
jgi:phosphoglycerol geranylgeranyltransferase